MLESRCSYGLEFDMKSNLYILYKVCYRESPSYKFFFSIDN